jgi:hypothetical protein
MMCGRHLETDSVGYAVVPPSIRYKRVIVIRNVWRNFIVVLIAGYFLGGQ